jgi:energy-coupling factor transporter ATP-binding protein EcfA2
MPDKIFLDNAFFGRETELKKIIFNALVGKNTLIIGKKGIGKTSLLEQAINIITGTTHKIEFSPTVLEKHFNDVRISQRLRQAWERKIKTLKIDLTKTKSTLFTEIIQTLYSNRDLEDPENAVEIAPDGSISIKTKTAQSVIIKSIKSKDYILFIDDLDLASAQLAEFILDLAQASTIIATTSELKNDKRLKHIYAMFEKINLDELPKETSIKLINYLIDKHLAHLKGDKREFLRNEVLHISKGNPNLIKATLSQAIAKKHIQDDDIRELRKQEELEYINLGPFFAFLIGSITIVKILQIGLENRETYILLSIFSFLAYLTIRIFRYFFLFRPQRKK